MSEASYSKSALIIVDMQNDFVHPEGGIAFRAAENPDAGIDIPFIQGTIPHVKQLAGAFRAAGRPVVYVTHVVRADRSDAHYPYWRLPRLSGNRTFIAEGSWGAQIVEELKPHEGEHVIVKRGYDGFANTTLDTVLRNLGVTTCVVVGVMTGVCVSSTVRGGVELNYHMTVIDDAVADPGRETHAAELKILARNFAAVKTTREVIALVGSDRR